MYTPLDRLQSLKVRDVMCRQVIVLRDSQPMDDVATTFRMHDISAAPVVDRQGECVGMLSSTDFLKRAGTPSSVDGDHVGKPDLARDYMTHPAWCIAPDDRMLQAVRVMCDHHVHRLPVVEGRRVVGVISTMDIAAALIHAVEEREAE